MRHRIIDSLWCLGLCLFILTGVADVPLHGDEPTLIFMGRDFYYHIHGNTEQVLFREWDTLTGDEATEQQLRLVNGTVSKYLYGAIAYISSYRLEDINQQWLWGAGWQWNHENGHVPDDDLLLRARYVSAVQLAISAVALFAIGYTVAGRAIAYLASGYYALNPAVLLNGRRAIMEGSMLAFTLLALLLALWLLKHRLWWQYVLLGIFSGLAVASKHTSVVTIAVIFATCCAYFVHNRSKENGYTFQPIASLLGSGLLSLIIFFALSPVWWSDPISVASNILELRQDLLSGQVEFFGGYEDAAAQLSGFARQSFVVLPMYAESDYDSFISEQIDVMQQYDSSLLSGVSLGGSVIGGILVFILTVLGAVRLCLTEKVETSSAWLMIAWFIGMIVLTLVLTPLEWQRYYLPIYPVIGVLAAMGLQFSYDTLIKQFRAPTTLTMSSLI